MDGATRARLQGWALLAVAGAAAWLSMMVVHELGHVLHAWMSGGRVERVVLHPLAFSRTDLSVNPRPLFVVWGGVIWGCVLPLAGCGLAHVSQGTSEHCGGAILPRFFAGFCCVANGAYLASAVVTPVGDAEDLLRLGVPVWALAASGLALIVAGAGLWRGLGAGLGAGEAREAMTDQARLPKRAVVWLVLVISGMLAWSWATSPGGNDPTPRRGAANGLHLPMPDAQPQAPPA